MTNNRKLSGQPGREMDYALKYVGSWTEPSTRMTTNANPHALKGSHDPPGHAMAWYGNGPRSSGPAGTITPDETANGRAIYSEGLDLQRLHAGQGSDVPGGRLRQISGYVTPPGNQGKDSARTNIHVSDFDRRHTEEGSSTPTSRSIHW